MATSLENQLSFAKTFIHLLIDSQQQTSASEAASNSLVDLFVGDGDQQEVVSWDLFGPADVPLFRKWEGLNGLREMIKLRTLLLDSQIQVQDFLAEAPNSRLRVLDYSSSSSVEVIIRVQESGKLKNTSKSFDSQTVLVLQLEPKKNEQGLRLVAVREHTNTHGISRAYVK
jgi:hypothetical protein